MVLIIGINGFGRIGRIAFRASLQHEDIKVTAINDPAIDEEYFRYLLKYDSTHGKFKGQLEIREKRVYVNGSLINIYQHKNPSSIPWQDSGVQYVIEASGVFTTQEKASGHLQTHGMKKVVVTAPSADIPMIILGVNENTLTTDTKVISCASSTLYCLAPIMQVLDKYFGVAEGFVTSIHALTPSLKPLDSVCVRGKHWRDHRSIHQNIIPAATGVCKALSKVLPHLKDKLIGIAFRVPVVDVSILDISVRLKTETNLEEISKRLDIVKRSYMKNIINVNKDEVVSSDFVEDSHSCTVDMCSSLQLKPNFFKIICWYENEYSYACRLIDTIKYCELLENNSRTNHIQILKKSCESCPTDKHNYYTSKRNVSKQDRRNMKDSSTSYSLTMIPIHIKNIVKDNISILFRNQSKSKQTSKPTDEKVEQLKEEVTKCVNITEDLLKDSRKNRLSFKSTMSNLISNDSISKNKDGINKRSGPYVLYPIKDMHAKVNAATDSYSSENCKLIGISNKPNYLTTTKKIKVLSMTEKILRSGKSKGVTSKGLHTDLNLPSSSNVAPLKYNDFENQHTTEKNILSVSNQQITSNENVSAKSVDDAKLNDVVLLENKNTSNPNNELSDFKIERFQEENKNSLFDEQNIILDKLGSVSGSASNDSFEINQRKSEIINLQDITKSLEDLPKLEQICKIMEISDDLSDRLFSPLNTASNRNLDRNTLKDLCNKINLDEFYDNIFCSCDDE